MTQYLPPNLMGLFAPREPIPFKPQINNKPRLKRSYSGLANYISLFENPCDTPPATRILTRDEIIKNKRFQRLMSGRKQAEMRLMEWDPNLDPNISGDPYKTLFVARLDYEVTESKIKSEFKHYGHIKKISLVNDKNTGKFKGYGFVEYEHERDMHTAYKKCDGIKVSGRRILVDVERGRTVKNWRPRYLGGGLGGGKRSQKSDYDREFEEYLEKLNDDNSSSIKKKKKKKSGKSHKKKDKKKEKKKESKHSKNKKRSRSTSIESDEQSKKPKNSSSEDEARDISLSQHRHNSESGEASN